MNIKKTSNKHVTPSSHITRFGDRFQMDFGFMKGKTDNISVRSHDGYNSYLLIIDYFTRYLWVFLSKNKQPPIKVLHKFLRTYGQQTGIRTIRTDQGGELARSSEFQQAITEAGYSIEITGSDNSAQNGVAERPHQTLANMVRAGIENAGLHVKYWSDALLHAVYIKNRLPHQHFQYKQTPYEKLTGLKPDLRKLRVFGSRLVARKPGRRSPKISKHSYTGIFLRYAKTMNNLVYLDTTTKKIKTTTYGAFDEAHFSYPDKPPGARILVELGLEEQPYIAHKDPNNIADATQPVLEVLKTSPEAKTPTKGTIDAAGYDLYSLHPQTIPPHKIGMVDTGIATKFPPNTYGRIAGRSGLAINNQIDVKGGVIDPDYTGNIKVILHNFGDVPFQICKHDRIAQLILEQYTPSNIVLKKSLPKTSRSDSGFGSTGIKTPHTGSTSHIIPHQDDEITPIARRATILQQSHIEMVFTKPIFTTTITMTKRGKHPTLGLDIAQTKDNIIINTCLSGTPAAKIPKWRQVLKGAVLHSIDGQSVTNMSDIKKQIAQKAPGESILLQVIPVHPTNIHPETGIPQINFDQFIHLCRTHQEVLEKANTVNYDDEVDDTSKIIVNKLDTPTLTRTKLLQQDDWKDWEASEFLQLDQYKRQKMFGEPGPISSNSVNILPMIWVYLVKTDGRKKARCVANGAAHLKGSITIANTYAACLEQAACRLFWSVVAMKNKKVYMVPMLQMLSPKPHHQNLLYISK